MIKRTLNFQSATNYRQKQTGFTLIELLVVITIIGILMGILLVSYQGARVSARDGKRKADLEQIRSALELYHADCGQYPTTISVTGGSLISSPPCPTASVTYMSQVPQDPLPTIYKYFYEKEDNHHYDLYAYLEGGGTTTTKDCDLDDETTTNCNYRAWEP